MKLDEILSTVTVAAKFGAIGLGAGRLLAVSGVLSGRFLWDARRASARALVLSLFRLAIATPSLLHRSFTHSFFPLTSP
jgi:hypothetical protein